ncbi:MAG: hypothetical protein KBH11_06465 [Bacteroidia bacterium]|nr:hypothetical protein [Bacteroidota bacterium]MBP9082699.1 hypothetical protein [Bacteroidia bacterium]
MNNLEKWSLGIPLSDFQSYEELKTNVYNHAQRDYLFFPLLIGYVERYLKNENSEEAIRNHVLQVIYDLSVEKNFKILFVNKKSLDEAKWNNLFIYSNCITLINIKLQNCSMNQYY